MSTVTREEAKANAALAAAKLVRPEEVLAVGSGSTVEGALRALAEMSRSGTRVPRVVTASLQAERVAKELEIRTTSLDEVDSFGMMIDGADEVAPNLTLIKGGGGAHFREKLLARLSRELIIMVDFSKLVRTLGEVAPLPLEVVPFAVPYLGKVLGKMGYPPILRQVPRSTGMAPFVTDNGNHILDLKLTRDLGDEAELDGRLSALPGVVGTGLFVHMASRVLIGMPDGTVKELWPTASERSRTPPRILEDV